MSDTPTPEAGAQPAAQQPQVTIDDSNTVPAYSNFCRVTATPEEVVLDFGLNPQPFAQTQQNIKANQRLVMNFFTAKRLLFALNQTIQRHEGMFGAVELDVRRRASNLTAQAAPGTEGEGPQLAK